MVKALDATIRSHLVNLRCIFLCAAALRVALYLPFPYPLLGVLLVIPAPLRDAIYDFVASRRYEWFGRADTCILPKEDVLDHFIDRDEIIAKLRQKRED